MNERERMAERVGGHIWLHYATTVTVGGRPHTFEMGIPVPLGADEELREQLLREADAGMNQLVSHVENQVARLLQRVQPTQGPIPAPMPAARPSVTPPPRPRPTSPDIAAVSANASPAAAQAARPAQASPTTQPSQQQPSQQSAASQYNAAQPSTSSQGRELREVREAREGLETRHLGHEQESDDLSPVSEPPSRPSIGASLPSTGEIGKALSLPQFISYINEHLGLTPKQAMEILKVKSLSGINLRDALEQLQRTHNGSNEKESGEHSERSIEKADATSVKAATNLQGQRAERAERMERIEHLDERPSKPDTRNNAPQQSPAKQPIPLRPNQGGSQELTPHARNVREAPAHFDEELDDDSDMDIDDELEDLLDDGEGEEDEPEALTPQERIFASNQVSRLRESQGASIASPARLKVLSNVIGDQLTEDQLIDLIQGIWSIPATKRLKVDQAEALISWAKEDDFQNEAEVVLMYLEEDALARGNR